jgi:hypothetical protein
MPGRSLKGTWPAYPQSCTPSGNVVPHSGRGLQPRRYEPFWFQLPDIRCTKVLLVEIILPPVAIARTDHVSAFRKGKSVSVSTPSVIRYKALFFSSVCRNGLKEQCTSSCSLRITSPLACCFEWLVLSLSTSALRME